jgi:hypothetical protein
LGGRLRVKLGDATNTWGQPNSATMLPTMLEFADPTERLPSGS